MSETDEPMISERSKALASWDARFDPYPDTGETGETYDEEMRSVVRQIAERIGATLQFPVEIILDSGIREGGRPPE